MDNTRKNLTFISCAKLDFLGFSQNSHQTSDSQQSSSSSSPPPSSVLLPIPQKSSSSSSPLNLKNPPLRLQPCSSSNSVPHRALNPSTPGMTLPGFHHSNESYRILVDVLGGNKQFAILWDFLVDTRECQGFRISPDVFRLVLRAYSRANLPNGAIRAFDRMVEFGLKPSVGDLDQLLYVLCKRKFVKHAHDFFDRVKHRFEPTVKSYSILVRGWGDVGDSAMARQVFEEMVERGSGYI